MSEKREVQYSERIDEVVYGNVTKGFTPREWILLATACIDQAGLSPSTFEDIDALLDEAHDEVVRKEGL